MKKKSIMEEMLKKLKEPVEQEDDSDDSFLGKMVAMNKGFLMLFGAISKCFDSLHQLVRLNSAAIMVLFVLFFLHLVVEFALR